ncbi:flavin reductase family protein [Luedemannella flava]|uniref:Flavin reductase family protein n=1 Tax=Luedemannella flava TaxID=349316 RepID=A0ABP4YC36_9ACTN
MEASTFDRFTGQLDYPMFVLTVPGSGCLIGFATQCSIDPPRFLACLSKANHTYRAAARALAVAVHRLGPADHDLAELFGTETGDEVDKLARCAWRPGPHGVPLLDRCPAWLVGEIDSRVDLGDHEGLLLRPIEVGPGADTPPLMFAAVRDLNAGHGA